MSMSAATPFVPTGDKPQWETLFEIFSERVYDDVVTYDEMIEALGPGHTRESVQKVVSTQVAKRLLPTEHKAVRAVPNVGYRIVRAAEHADLAKRDQVVARRRIGRSRDLIVHADYSALTPEQRKAFEEMNVRLSAQEEHMRRLDIRTKRTQRVAEALAEKVEGHDDALAELQRKVEDLVRERQQQ